MNDGIYVSPWVVVLVAALAAGLIAFIGGRATASHPKSLSASEVQQAVDAGVSRATDKMAQRFVNEVASGFQAASADADAGADVRLMIPAVEAYFADHGTYVGMTMKKLRSNYDASLDPTTSEIVSAGAESYCVQATRGTQTWFKAGPYAKIERGSCP